MTNPFVIRPVTEAEYEAYGKCLAPAFGGDYDQDEQARERELIPLAETLAAFEGDRLVGTEGAFRMTVTIPGGEAPMAGVTSVSVLPTHRRRGVLTAMMRHRLEDMHYRGQWLAGLWASESMIYGRFGYGLATERLRLEVQKHRSAFAHASAAPTVRLLERAEAGLVIPPIYARAASARPGMIARDSRWWTHLWHDPKEHRDGRSALLFAVHATGGLDDAYAVYRTRFDWASRSTSEVYVEDLVSTSDSGYAGTWRYLLDIDLLHLVVAGRRPLDDPLPWLLADRGAVSMTVMEAMWLRLVDVPVALAARAYPATDTLVLEVHDTFCPWNAGRYLLTTGPEGASCKSTSRQPDLVLGAAELAAIYLGGVRPSTLAQAQLVREDVQGALARADEVFRWLPVPWCDRVF